MSEFPPTCLFSKARLGRDRHSARQRNQQTRHYTAVPGGDLQASRRLHHPRVHASAKGTPVTVIASRGGGYGPGTPMEANEYVQNYLQVALGFALGLDVEFIVPELTMAPRNPAMAELIPLYEASRDHALQEAVIQAKRLADRSAA